MKKILIFGSSGRLGEYIKKNLKINLDYLLLDIKKKNIKLTFLNKSEILKIIIKNKPDVIINCAGATDVEKCIKNYNYAYRGNTIIPRNIVSVLKIIKINHILFIFLQIRFMTTIKVEVQKKI